MTPRSKSDTVTRELGSTNIREPPIRQAVSLTRIVSSIAMEPSCNRSNTISKVINLLIDAGGIRASAFFSNRVAPVARSIITAWVAGVSTVCAPTGRPPNKPTAIQRQDQK